MVTQERKVRFGGQEIDGVFRFELTGGALILDFVNTLDERQGEQRELLANPARLLDWSEQIELISPQTRIGIEKWTRANSDRAEVNLIHIRAARETVFALLTAQTLQLRPSNDALCSFNKLRHAADDARRMASVAGAYIWTYDGDQNSFDEILWPIIHAAADLLVGEAARRIKLCEGSTCAWAFLDTSRRSNRRWCDMSVCGNRAKVRRHRAKGPTKAKTAGAV